MMLIIYLQIATEAQGKAWSVATSSARNYVSNTLQARGLSSSSSYPRFDTSGHGSNNSGGYHGGSGGMSSVASYQGGPTSMEDAFGMSKYVVIMSFVGSLAFYSHIPVSVCGWTCVESLQ